MTEITIKTNNQPRELLSWFDLTEAEQKEFDYYDNPEEETGTDFFRYRGQVYTLSDFMRLDDLEHFPNWHGHKGQSYFSGLLVRLIDSGDGVIVGRYYQ